MRWVRGGHELDGALALREEVFCGEQGVPREEELDGRDGEALHLVALDTRASIGEGTGADAQAPVIGTLRLLFSGEVAKIGRVAVARTARRRGIASRMLMLALAEARERGALKARLAAQIDALSLYEQAGFAVESEPFLEAGITHVWMGRSLQ